MGDGKDISAPAVDVLNENPLLSLSGKIPFVSIVRIVSGSSADRPRMRDGKDISAPAVDLLNENPSLVAFGKNT